MKRKAWKRRAWMVTWSGRTRDYWALERTTSKVARRVGALRQSNYFTNIRASKVVRGWKL